MKPVRITLSRRAGFDLQVLSRAINGLPAQSVARPGPWGNPFSIDDLADETGLDRAAAQVEAVCRHAQWVAGERSIAKVPPSIEDIRQALSGKNLACWCREGTPCHVDTLLKLANS